MSFFSVSLVIINPPLLHTHLPQWGEEDCTWDFGGKFRRTETTRKT
jgi:hypothetical protein